MSWTDPPGLSDEELGVLWNVAKRLHPTLILPRWKHLDPKIQGRFRETLQAAVEQARHPVDNDRLVH